MAEFALALQLLMKWEGEAWHDYAHDRGRETYCGISRQFWGDHPIWAVVDEAKQNVASVNRENMTKYLNSDSRAQKFVSDFYHNWWVDISAGLIKNQHIANTFFQASVNCGKSNAATWLQMSVCSNGISIRVDGKIGVHTIAGVNGIKNIKEFLGDFCILQQQHYISCIAKNDTDYINKKGWYARAISFREANDEK